jgi:phenylpyruvate tautomerase PptA (4-oxalocrotonate tautomerase family)
MPLIQIKSLPFDPPRDMSEVIEAISRDFANEAGVDLEYMSVTWEFLQPGQYAVGGQTAHYQLADSHPVLVDILSPDFNPPDQVEKMLKTLASTLARHATVHISNIFINHREAYSGRVFDVGEVVYW